MGNKASDEVWVLLAKYLFDEATPVERLLIEDVLKNDAGLRNFGQQINGRFIKKGDHNVTRVARAFKKLDGRIKASKSHSKDAFSVSRQSK